MTLLAGLQGTWPVVISYHASTIEFGRVLIWLYIYLALPFQLINVFCVVNFCVLSNANSYLPYAGWPSVFISEAYKVCKHALYSG